LSQPLGAHVSPFVHTPLSLRTSMTFSLKVKKCRPLSTIQGEEKVDFEVTDSTHGALGYRRVEMPSPYGEGNFNYVTGAQQQGSGSAEGRTEVNGGQYLRADRDINVTNCNHTNHIVHPISNPLAGLPGVVAWSSIWRCIVMAAKTVFNPT